jgi:hypothetical protein
VDDKGIRFVFSDNTGYPCVHIDHSRGVIEEDLIAMKSKYLFFIILLFSLHLSRAEKEPFSIKYCVSGGEAGFLDTLVLKGNGSMRYHGRLYYNRECYHQDTINLKYIDTIVETLKKYGFMDLKDKYGPSYHCDDGSSHSIAFHLGSTQKTVVILECTDMNDIPDAFKIVEKKMVEILKNAWPNIECGTLYPRVSEFLKKWPFSTNLSLTKIFEAESSKVNPNNPHYVGTDRRIVAKAPQCVIEMFADEEKKMPDFYDNIAYYENSYVYYLYSNYFSRKHSSSDSGQFKIYISGRIKPDTIPTEIGVRLSNISEEGIFIKGQEFSRIMDFIKGKMFFVDLSANYVDFLYDPEIVLGNCSNNMPPYDRRFQLLIKANKANFSKYRR